MWLQNVTIQEVRDQMAIPSFLLSLFLSAGQQCPADLFIPRPDKGTGTERFLQGRQNNRIYFSLFVLYSGSFTVYDTAVRQGTAAAPGHPGRHSLKAA